VNSTAEVQTSTGPASLIELAGIFLRLGTTAFGGPAAHIAMMRTEFVDRRGWLSEGEFLDLVGASNLIPGPGSTEVAIFIGMRRCGWPGLILAGACFILPAALIVTAIAAVYVKYGRLPQTAGVLYGIKPVIIAVVAQALYSLGRAALKSKFLAGMAIAGLALCFLRVAPLLILFGTGGIMGAIGWFTKEETRSAKPLAAIGTVVALLLGLPAILSAIQPPASSSPRPWPLFLAFAKIGSVIFGSGYVLLVFLRTELVTRLHWLSQAQLLDSVAVGQFTPGPVFTTATFIGYILAGLPGALIATLGIFLPAFLFVAISGPLIPRIRKSPTAASFLDGVNAAALSLMAFVTFQLGRAALIDWLTFALAIVSAVVLFKWKVNSALLVLVGAIVGFFVHR
jgi:chromate transporter